MSEWIQPKRVRDAVVALSEWRQLAKSQAAMHLWPLLALLESGVNKESLKPFSEKEDFAFWDKYCRMPAERRGRMEGGDHTPNYYLDALVSSLKPADYPHRGPWSIRTRTFLNAWKAAEALSDNKVWRLSANFAEIFVKKVLLRDGIYHGIPVVDLGVLLFRTEEFPDGAIVEDLRTRFRERFPMEPSDYEQLFVFSDEERTNVFTSIKPPSDDYTAAIEEAIVPENVPIPIPTPLFAPSPTSENVLEENDPVLLQVQKLLAFGTSGIMFRGCPGTSKSWYAKQIARSLTSDVAHIFQVQFHPSYGYEDFVEGYRPNDSAKSGFSVVDKIFLTACELARSVQTPVVFIIDEINRGDPARILGELLTYIETDYRSVTFYKAYTGAPATIPHNLLVFGTMNQYDKSITQLDLALMRRFDHVDLKPSVETLQSFLSLGEFTAIQADRIVQWFEALQNILSPETGGIGHTYFKNVRRPDQWHTVWQYRMLPYCESLLELEPQKLDSVKKSFESAYRFVTGQTELTQPT